MAEAEHDTFRPPPPSCELPRCEACGKQTLCNLVLLANDERWYLCPDVCLPALLAEARGWLRREQRHNAILGDAAAEDEEDARELATLAELDVTS
jgi:hypothetical protein